MCVCANECARGAHMTKDRICIACSPRAACVQNEENTLTHSIRIFTMATTNNPFIYYHNI